LALRNILQTTFEKEILHYTIELQNNVFIFFLFFLFYLISIIIIFSSNNNNSLASKHWRIFNKSRRYSFFWIFFL